MGLWYDETFHDHTRLSLLSKETLFSAQSPYQKIEVIDTVGFGRVLIIDNVFMTSEYDEFLYHEMLAHPALTTAPDI
ncbi:MAG: spermidine synthase, partial [Deltaproteobacteria bacterium]|nr:spermidine synthase [Deltaproteobacteria bacterium]